MKNPMVSSERTIASFVFKCRVLSKASSFVVKYIITFVFVDEAQFFFPISGLFLTFGHCLDHGVSKGKERKTRLSDW
jgi:hypothetical protein